MMQIEVPCDFETPVSLFSRWQDEKYAALLESAEGGEKWGRYSFIGLYPSHIVRSRPGCDPLPELRKSMPFDFAQGRGAATGVGGRFAGGLVGYVSYDAVRRFEKIPQQARDDLKLPDFCFFRPRLVLVLDNLKHSLKIVSDNRSLIDRALRILKRPSREGGVGRGKELRWRQTLTKGEFEKRVRKVKEYILAGDVTQAVLSVRFSAAARVDPFQLYRRLRQVNPSPYLFYLKMGDLQIAGASPETMVRLEQGEMILRPIAGTRPRGKTEAEDRRLERELLADPKERAEHIMLVDLGRNDLGRVAEPGSVKVDELMKVERYSHVMHLVSNVRGRLPRRKDAFDLLRAAFPAGTLTGSPKVRAMEIIEELEPVRRGIYGGSVGYFSDNGNMDMAITIRSALFHKGKVYVQAGAGIVADSVPAREYEECVNKAKGILTCFS